MLEDGPSVCELCGGSLRRVLFPAGIIFKGSGFYRNDSRASSSSSGSENGGSEKSSGSEKGSATGTDAGSGSTTAKDGQAKTPAKKTEASGEKSGS